MATQNLITANPALSALSQLKANPIDFLHFNIIMMGGPPTSGEHHFYFGKHGRDPGPQPNGVQACFRLNHIDSGFIDPVQITCKNVRMIPATEKFDVADIEAYSLGGMGADILVTGQLSGCAFCVLKLGANVVVAHIQPGGTRGTGANLQTLLQKSGRFHGFKNWQLTYVYGAAINYAARAYAVGIRQNGEWRIFGQAVSGSDVDAQVVSVKRII